jgi:hypothetical protein
MNDKDLRQAFALVLTMGLAGDLISDNLNPRIVWNLADMLVESQNNKEEELGIAAVKTKRQYARKADYK